MDAFYFAFYWQGCHHCFLSVNIFLLCFFTFLFSTFCVTSFWYVVSYNQPVHIFVVQFIIQLESVQKQKNLIHSYLLSWKLKVSVAQSTLCDAMDHTAHHTPLSMALSRQEYYSELLFPSPGDVPDPGIEPWSPALQADSSLSEPPTRASPWWILCWHLLLLSFFFFLRFFGVGHF